MPFKLNSARIGNKPELGIYGILFATLVGAAVWLGLDLADGRRRIIAEGTTMAIQKSQFMSQWFGTMLISADYVLRDINDKIAPEILTGSDPERIKRWGPWLDEKMRTVPGVAGISIYNSDCIFIAAADVRVIGFRSQQQACAEPQPRIEDRTNIQYVPAEKSASKRPVILVSRHILTSEGKLEGGAVAAIDLSFAQQWINTFPVGSDDVLAVVDGGGTLLARNPAMPEAIGKTAPRPAEQPAFGEGRASAGFIATSPLDGRKRIFGMSKIEGVPIAIIVGYDLTETLSEWLRRAWQLSCGYGVVIILSLLTLRANWTTLRQREEMRKLATTDALTGIANRRHLVETGEHEVRRLARYGGCLSILMLDIDHFKSVNDTWGHPTGDRVIQALARTVTGFMRDQDMVGRLGGEEFAALLPETDLGGAQTIAERLRTAIQDAAEVTADDGSVIRFTVSIGISAMAVEETFEDVIRRADQGLYKAKESGRNCVMTG